MKFVDNNIQFFNDFEASYIKIVHFSFYLISDKKTQPRTCQTSNEPVYGMESD